MLHILSRSVEIGFARSLVAMAGCLTAVIACVTASSLGLGALLTSSPTLFAVARSLGAAYLIWLGVGAWRSCEGATEGLIRPSAPTAGASAFAIYRTAALVAFSNPKLIVFAAAFFPQFIRTDAAWGRQFAILVVTFAVIEVAFYLAYALGGRYLAAALSSPPRRRLFNRLVGSLFLLFGVGLLAYRQ